MGFKSEYFEDISYLYLISDVIFLTPLVSTKVITQEALCSYMICKMNELFLSNVFTWLIH